MEIRTEFTGLEAHKLELERQLGEARKQAAEGMITGKLELAVELWMKRTQQELDELNYVLKMAGSQQNRIEITGHTLLIAMVSYAVFLLVIVVLFVRYLGA